MTNPNEFSKVFAAFQNAFPFDQKTIEEGAKTMAGFGERFASVGFDTVSKSSEIAARATQDSIANLRGVSVVRDEPSDYAQAMADFAQSQFELAVRVAEEFGVVAQQAQTSAVELVSKANEAVHQQAAVNINSASKPTKAAGPKAA
ncbi:phasin family protein [Tropicimonas sp. IMCC6043]|uniref:phasin family protein n=1 Tax=Tropicimonas sp. IMCC6043 TaxID=2510645 RepID=UPI00101DE156|nr:phasin family protein [Tropicimonas sp. IMCC6043]RYH07362.1 hypothetical protein EU800_20465 [Tropicimonas sp. IMCC6043]